MGWLWASTPSPGSTPSKESPFPHDNAMKPFPHNETSSPPQSPGPPPSKPLSRDELAEQELNSILQEFTAANSAPKRPIYNRKTRGPNNESSNPDSSSEPVGSQILPTTMSCRQAFDSAFYCNSFGGRFNDLYRYGTLRSCNEHWNDFWFCMKTRTRSGPEKEEAIKDFYREKERVKYSRELGKESSEDVWKSRGSKVEWGEAFNAPFPPVFTGSDEEWRAIDSAARKASRERSNGTMS